MKSQAAILLPFFWAIILPLNVLGNEAPDVVDAGPDDAGRPSVALVLGGGGAGRAIADKLLLQAVALIFIFFAMLLGYRYIAGRFFPKP